MEYLIKFLIVFVCIVLFIKILNRLNYSEFVYKRLKVNTGFKNILLHIVIGFVLSFLAVYMNIDNYLDSVFLAATYSSIIVIQNRIEEVRKACK